MWKVIVSPSKVDVKIRWDANPGRQLAEWLREGFTKYSVGGSCCHSCHVLFHPSPHGPFQPHFVYGKIEQKWLGDFLQPEPGPKRLILSPLFFYSILPYAWLCLGHSWASLPAWDKPWTFTIMGSVFSYTSFADWEGGLLAIRTATHSHWLLPQPLAVECELECDAQIHPLSLLPTSSVCLATSLILSGP